jgi:hypothetical protein
MGCLGWEWGEKYWGNSIGGGGERVIRMGKMRWGKRVTGEEGGRVRG